MCERLTLLDGTELGNVGQLIEHGILDADDYDATPGYAGHDPLKECLCILELKEVLAGHGSAWKPTSPFGWEQYDDEGRSYWKDAMILDEAASTTHMHVTIPNPDYPHTVGGAS